MVVCLFFLVHWDSVKYPIRNEKVGGSTPLSGTTKSTGYVTFLLPCSTVFPLLGHNWGFCQINPSSACMIY